MDNYYCQSVRVCVCVCVCGGLYIVHIKTNNNNYYK